MNKDDLKLNSVSRYSKRSPQFTLEVHDHCEVPAGCGGFVLRWLNPRSGVPVKLFLFTPGEADFFLDGQTPASACPLVEYGEHVIAMRLAVADANRGFLLFAATAESGKGRPQVLSAADGSWTYSLLEPPGGDAWTRVEFYDADWEPMVARPFTVPHKNDPASYRYQQVAGTGAQPLGIKSEEDTRFRRILRTFGVARPGPAVTVWVRRKFLLPKARFI